MKRNISLILAVLVGLIMLAQSKMNFHFSWGVDEINISDIDTIRFSNGNITVEGANKTYSIANVDSATFSLETVAANAGDTVFVVYNGASAEVINPYSTISDNVDGANVTIISSAATKGIVYCLSGTSTQGSFNFTPDKGYTLVFDNLSLSNTNAPIVLNEGLDEESYAATVHLRGTSTLSDSENNTLKAALYTKSKLKISYDSAAVNEGSLTVTGNQKHAINSSKRIELYSGKLAIAGAASDGINADGLELYNGELNIENTLGDGVDCSEMIQVENGTISIKTTADDTKGLKCDSLIKINGGTITIDVTGAGSKAIKSGLKTTVSGGVVTATLGATQAFVEDNEYSYNAAITSDGDIELNGNGKIIVKGAGIAARALSADADVAVNGGELNVNLTGSYSIESGDTTSVFGIKADRSAIVSDGTTTITIGNNANIAKGIKADYVYVKGGNLTVTNNGGFWYTSSTSSSGSSSQFGGGSRFGGGGSSSSTSVNSSTPKTIRGEKLISVTGGVLDLTCVHGKGITADSAVVIGTKNGSDDDLTLKISAGSTSDATYTSRASENSRTKYCSKPKGINCEQTVEINSGTLDITSYDTGIQGYSVDVNGGKITIEATKDQAIHGLSTLTVNDGDIYVSNSFEAFEAITITMNGGITSCYATDDGWNATVAGTGLSGTPIIVVNGGYHYLNLASGDTDCLDSNGTMKFTGGVVIVEGGSTLDGNGSSTYTGGKLMLFGSGIETSPSGATTTSGSAGSSNTLYTAASNGNVVSSFTTTKSSSILYFLYNSSVSLTSGGTISNPTKTVNFRWSDKSTLTYTEGGTISNGTALSSSGSGGGYGPGGFGF